MPRAKAPVLDADRMNHANVAVEHFLIVVVFNLHDLIAASENKPAPVQPLPYRVQCFLQRKVQALNGALLALKSLYISLRLCFIVQMPLVNTKIRNIMNFKQQTHRC